MQAFNEGRQLAHSGMNASALYLFHRIFSLAKVWTAYSLCVCLCYSFLLYVYTSIKIASWAGVIQLTRLGRASLHMPALCQLYIKTQDKFRSRAGCHVSRALLLMQACI